MTDYKLMPKQITKEMADAFWEEFSKSRTDDLLMRCYKAMHTVAPQPTEPDEERLAMEAVMESIDPATWPGLTTAQRCALGRFAKPQPAKQRR